MKETEELKNLKQVGLGLEETIVHMGKLLADYDWPGYCKAIAAVEEALERLYRDIGKRQLAEKGSE